MRVVDTRFREILQNTPSSTVTNSNISDACEGKEGELTGEYIKEKILTNEKS